jgi:hypothetical protein
MNTYKKVIHILSGTDDDIIEQMPIHVKRKRAGWAYMLIFTSILSFLGTYHFMITMFIKSSFNNMNISVFGYIMALSIALFYSGGMALFTIDSMSSSSKIYAFLRMPISFIGSVLIALALTLSMFSDSIYQKINENLKQKTVQYLKKNIQIDTSLNNAVVTLQQEIDNLNLYKKDMMQEATNFSKLAYNEEIGKGLNNAIAECGHKCKKFQSQKLDALLIISQTDKKLQKKYKEINSLRKKISQENETRKIASHQYSKKLNDIQSYDILTQIKILQEILQEDPINFIVFILLILMLIILDLLPTLSKIFTEKNEYDVLLLHRRKSNIAKLMAIFNANINKISKGNTSINIIPQMTVAVEK